MNKFDQIYRYFGYIKKLCIVIASVAIAVMVLLITIDVLSRNLLNNGIAGSYEIVESILMPTAIFWALLVTYSSGSIPRIDLVTEKFSGNIKLILGILLIAIDIFIYGLLTYYSWSRAEIALSSGASISAGGNLINIAPIFLFVPLGFLLVTLEAIFILLKMILDKKYHYYIDPDNEPMKE